MACPLLFHALNALRLGQKPDLSTFTPKQQRQLMEASRSAPQELAFKRLSLMDKLQAWDRASDAEREQYHLRQHILTNRLGESLRNLSADQRSEAVQRLQQIRQAGIDQNKIASAR